MFSLLDYNCNFEFFIKFRTGSTFDESSNLLFLMYLKIVLRDGRSDRLGDKNFVIKFDTER